MIAAAHAEDVRPPTTPPSPPPPPPPPPIPSPSPSARPTSLGRRLLGSIRALASRPAPPPPLAAAAPKVIGLGLLLHLSPDHPRLRPAPPPSPPPSASEEGDAAAARPHAAAGAGTRLPATSQCRPCGDGAAPAPTNTIFFSNSGPSEEENLARDKEKAGEQQRAVHRRQAVAAPVEDADAAGAGDDHQEKVRAGDQLRDGNGTTCRGTAAQDDQAKEVQQRDTRELGAAENDAEDDGQLQVVEQGVIDTAMCDDNAVKDRKVVGRTVISGTQMHAATTDVQDQHKGVDTAAVLSSDEAVSATVHGSDRAVWKRKVRLPYPQRPGKQDCPSYMSKGSCSSGFSCQFHHPLLKSKPNGSWRPSEQGTHSTTDILELNRIGLPVREGARNCAYYMRNGACRYGRHCHFNHPEHAIDAQFYAPKGWEDSTLEFEKSSDLHTTLDDTSHLKKSSNGVTLDETLYSKKSSDHATLDGTLYSKKSSDHATIDNKSSSSEVLPQNILRMLLPSQKVLPGTEGKVMEVKKDSNWSSTPDDSDSCCSADSSDGPLCKQEHVDSSDGPLCKQEHVDYPERPGEPECPFYMKKGFCKFMAKCRFNHPQDSNPTAQSPTNAKKLVATDEHHQSTRITLEDHMPHQQQYPERPGQPDCRYYLQYGKCKFLSACIFHHPRDGLPVGWNPSGPARSDQIGPVIHGMPECPFYMKSGKCQFGSACEFYHPKDICSTTETAFGHRTDLANDNFTRSENVMQKQEQTMYPERPGEPRCFNYMRHGSCRFQMNCKYHHPADRLSRKQYDSTYH